MNGTPAMLERASFPLEVGRHLLAFDTDSGSIFEHLSAQGVELYRAENAIGAIPAPEYDATHLEVSPGSCLLRVRRRTSDPRGGVLEIADDRYLPEYTEFTIVNTRTGTAGLRQQARRDS